MTKKIITDDTHRILTSTRAKLTTASIEVRRQAEMQEGLVIQPAPDGAPRTQKHWDAVAARYLVKTQTHIEIAINQINEALANIEHIDNAERQAKGEQS